MRLSLLEILEATGGGEVGGTQVGETFSTFHTDSREVQVRRRLLRAARGRDGRPPSSSATRSRAARRPWSCERRPRSPTGIVEVVVPDTWKALYALASQALRRVQPLVVAITGSNGKTSTKEMIAAILAPALQRPAHRGQPQHRDRRAADDPAASSRTTRRWCSRWACSDPGDIARLAAAREARDRRHHEHRHRAHGVLPVARGAGARQGRARRGACLKRASRCSTPTNEFYPLLAQMTAARSPASAPTHGDFRVEGLPSHSTEAAPLHGPRRRGRA